MDKVCSLNLFQKLKHLRILNFQSENSIPNIATCFVGVSWMHFNQWTPWPHSWPIHLVLHKLLVVRPKLKSWHCYFISCFQPFHALNNIVLDYFSCIFWVLVFNYFLNWGSPSIPLNKLWSSLRNYLQGFRVWVCVCVHSFTYLGALAHWQCGTTSTNIVPCASFLFNLLPWHLTN